MKRLFLLLILFPLLFSAQLRLSNIYELYTIKADNVSSYVINGLGFKNISYKTSESSEDFEFYNGKNSFAEAVYIKIQVPFINTYKNIVTIRSANENYIQELKSEAITDGYEYVGKRELKSNYLIHMYVKNSVIISISEQKNTSGFYEINMLSKL